MDDIVVSAQQFATQAHGSQTRKYNNKPYITHPIAVMKRLKQFTNDSNVLAAALLHDVVEDTSITIDEIRAEFGRYCCKFGCRIDI